MKHFRGRASSEAHAPRWLRLRLAGRPAIIDWANVPVVIWEVGRLGIIPRVNGPPMTFVASICGIWPEVKTPVMMFDAMLVMSSMLCGKVPEVILEVGRLTM